MASSRRIPRIIYNDDSCTLRLVPPPHTEASISNALNHLRGSQVDWLCWCVGEQIAYSWPSKVIENIYELRKKAAEIPGWDCKNDAMESLHRRNIDYLPLLIKQAHRQKLMFAASFRMNDTHLKSNPNGVLAPEFWKENQALRLWGVTDGKSYYNAGLDYSFAKVRDRYFAAIMEVAASYDIDGIELDFTRTPYLFQPNEAWAKRGILTRWITRIRRRLDRLGQERGRPISLLIRMPADEQRLKKGGIDARIWIRRKLMDYLVVSELVNNYNQTLEPWKGLCREAGVPLYPAVEHGPAFMNADFYSPLVSNSAAPSQSLSIFPRRDEDVRLQRAAAQNLLAQGSTGIAMFNFACKLVEGGNLMHRNKREFRKLSSVLSELGSLKTLAYKDKRYAFYKDLPIYVEAGRPRQFHQTVVFCIRGSDIRHGDVTLSFHQIAERSPHAEGDYIQNPIVERGLLRYFLNGSEIPARDFRRTRVPGGRIASGFLLGNHEMLSITVPGRMIRDGENTLAFEMPKAPSERDPYVYIYELNAEARFAPGLRTRRPS